ncbi:MAG: PhzF family phenazine biosynthesis protein [bacterium]|nr:PhzF family phenazine biosynthesis protein [bacterium]
MKMFTVDAFTDQPFSGNQAAICLLDGPCSDAWMQALAREINYSETAFLLEREEGFHLRWFTPAYEVDLCGHATLAAAHALWNEIGLAGASIHFETRSGILTAERLGPVIQLDFPATPPVASEENSTLMQALQVEPAFVGSTKFDAFVVVRSESQVREMKPDFALLSTLNKRGIIVTAHAVGSHAPKPYDFISRFFAPSAGIDEDPVTGSAHCALAPYWSQEMNKTELIGYQASARGGFVEVELRNERVLLRGRAVTIVRGELAIPAA